MIIKVRFGEAPLRTPLRAGFTGSPRPPLRGSAKPASALCAHACNSTAGALIYRKRLTIDAGNAQESFRSRRSRGGHAFPAFSAARFASRIATILFACARVSSRRLARPPRRPIFARYSYTRFSVSIYPASILHRKRVMMEENLSSFWRATAATDAFATARLSN
jgi:hypothetical protein